MRGDYRRDDGTCTKYHAMLITGAALARPAVSSCETGGAGTSSWRSAYLEWRRPILHDPSAYAVCNPQLAVPAGFVGTAHWQAAAPYAEAGRIDARQPREF